MGVFQNNLLAGAGGQAAGATGFYSYQIEQSLIMSSSQSTQLIRTNGTPSDQKKWTMSYWFKVQDPSTTSQSQVQMVTAGTSGSQYFFTSLTGGTSYPNVWKREYGGLGYLNSNMKVRDTTGWYHCVHRVDTTQSTDSDRDRVYINGNQLTWLTAQGPNYPTLNSDYAHVTQNTVQIAIGGITGIATGVLGSDVSYAEFILADGQSYAPTQFGETKNGVWIPKDPSGTTFGNNGWHLKFENASDLGNDSSGNNNDFTANNMGTDHQVLDSPTFGS